MCHEVKYPFNRISGLQVAQAMPNDLFRSGGVMQFLEKKILAPFGNPVFIVTDNDTKFRNATIRKFMKQIGIKWNHVSTYIPRGSAKGERMVGTLKRSIKKLFHSKNVEWDICLDCILKRVPKTTRSWWQVPIWSYVRREAEIRIWKPRDEACCAEYCTFPRIWDCSYQSLQGSAAAACIIYTSAHIQGGISSTYAPRQACTRIQIEQSRLIRPI